MQTHKNKNFNTQGQYWLDFDGVNECINIDTAVTPLLSTTTGTFSLWVKMTDSTPATTGYMIAFGDTTSNTAIEVLVGTTGLLTFRTRISATTQWSLQTDTAFTIDNVWTHVAVVQDGVSPVIYINGVAVAQTFTVTTNKTKWFSTIAGLDSGRLACRNVNSGSNTDFLKVILDEVTLWNDDFSAAEVLQIYNGGNRIDLNTHSKVSNLVGYYRLGDASSIYDGTNWNIPNHKSYLENMKAITFDGVNEAINIDTVLTPLASTTVGTWSAWFRPVNVTSATSDCILSFGDTDANSSIELTRQFTDGKLRALLVNAGTVQWNLATNAIAFSNNTWTHVAVVQDGVSPVLYVNGVAVAQTFATTTDKTQWFNNIAGLDNGRIAMREQSSDIPCAGEVDEVRIYNTALSADQVLAIYNKGTPAGAIAPVTDTDLVAWYRMGDAPLDTNTVIQDVHGGYNGTGVNLESADISYSATLRAISVNMESTDLITGNNNIPGWSLDYDGVNESVSVAHPAFNFERTDTFSVSVWFKTSSATTNQALLSKRDGTPGFRGWIFNHSYPISSNLRLQVQLISDNATLNRLVLSGNSNLSANTWYHALFTNSGSSTAAGIKIYLNGVEETKTVITDALTATIQNTQNTFIGNTGTLWMNGNIAHTSIWNKTLSAAEVTAIYNGGSPSDLSQHSAVANLVAWYREDKSSFETNWILKDVVGGYNGTSANVEAVDMIPDAPHSV